MRIFPVALTLVALGLSACGHPSSMASSGGDDKFLRVAQAAEESGDNDLALSIYAKASAASPHDEAIQLRYADALIKGGKITEARSLLTRSIRSISDAKSLHGLLGMIDVIQGEPSQALSEFDAANGNSMDEPRWTTNKAVALDMLGRHTDAQKLYHGVLAASPDDTVAINDLSLSLLLSGQKAEALQVSQRLAGRTDLSPRVQADVGVVMAANGDLAGAHRVIGSSVDDGELTRLTTALK